MSDLERARQAAMDPSRVKSTEDSHAILRTCDGYEARLGLPVIPSCADCGWHRGSTTYDGPTLFCGKTVPERPLHRGLEPEPPPDWCPLREANRRVESDPRTDAERVADEAARAAALACLSTWETLYGDAPSFAWPLDGIAHRGFGYWLTDRATRAWNEEERRTPCGAFFRKWLTDPGNVEAAMVEARKAWRQGVSWGVDDPECRVDLGIPLRRGGAS